MNRVALLTLCTLVILPAGVTAPVASEAPAANPPVGTEALPGGGGGDLLDEDERPARGAAKLAIAREPFPAEVRKALAWGRKECRNQGGGAVTFAAGIVRTGDLTGDGQPDFIVDFRGSRCANYFGMFNGTGGWDMEILVAKGRGRFAQVFAGRVLDYDISDGPGARVMTFDLHGGFCGSFGADPCAKQRRIDARRFRFRDR